MLQKLPGTEAVGKLDTCMKAAKYTILPALVKGKSVRQKQTNSAADNQKKF
jgi:hypothetical protein